MSHTEPTGPTGVTEPSGDQCPHCSATLVHGTVDFADTPSETSNLDLGRAELRPGQMVQLDTCPTPGCQGPDSGAVL